MPGGASSPLGSVRADAGWSWAAAVDVGTGILYRAFSKKLGNKSKFQRNIQKKKKVRLDATQADKVGAKDGWTPPAAVGLPSK